MKRKANIINKIAGKRAGILALEGRKLKTAKWIAFGIAILSGVECLLSCCVPWFIGRLYFNEASAIGIIGGADGPTRFFVSGGNRPQFIIPVIFAVSLFAWLFFRWKTKKPE